MVLLLCQAKGSQQILALKTVCPDPNGFGEEFYSNGSRAGVADKNPGICRS